MKNKKTVSGKMMVIMMSLMLVVGLVTGGTIAWLTDKTDPVTNTFTYGDINIDLTETTTTYKIVPGVDIAKDPTVKVDAKSETCYVFVKVDKSSDWPAKVTYSYASGWTDMGNGIICREVVSSDADQTFNVLAGDKVTVDQSMTKQEVEAAKSKLTTLTFKAAAVQKANSSTENFTPEQALALVNWDN